MAMKKKTPPPKKAALPVKATPKSVVASSIDEEMERDRGAGSESATSADFAIPFLVILQAQSPQCMKGNPARIEGAEAGHFLDTVTGQVYEQLRVIPCAYKRQLNEWVHRDDGGGFRGTHPWDEALAAKARDRDFRTEEGNTLVDTAQWYVLYEDEAGEWRPAVISMTSTQLTKSRKWMSLIRSIKKTGKHGSYNPAMFSHLYTVTSEGQSNDQGSWFGYSIVLDEEVKDIETYRTAKSFYESVVGGTVKVQEPTRDFAETESTPDSDDDDATF